MSSILKYKHLIQQAGIKNSKRQLNTKKTFCEKGDLVVVKKIKKNSTNIKYPYTGFINEYNFKTRKVRIVFIGKDKPIKKHLSMWYPQKEIKIYDKQAIQKLVTIQAFFRGLIVTNKKTRVVSRRGRRRKRNKATELFSNE